MNSIPMTSYHSHPPLTFFYSVTIIEPFIKLMKHLLISCRQRVLHRCNRESRQAGDPALSMRMMADQRVATGELPSSSPVAVRTARTWVYSNTRTAAGAKCTNSRLSLPPSNAHATAAIITVAEWTGWHATRVWRNYSTIVWTQCLD